MANNRNNKNTKDEVKLVPKGEVKVEADEILEDEDKVDTQDTTPTTNTEKVENSEDETHVEEVDTTDLTDKNEIDPTDSTENLISKEDSLDSNKDSEEDEDDSDDEEIEEVESSELNTDKDGKRFKSEVHGTPIYFDNDAERDVESVKVLEFNRKRDEAILNH